MKLASITFWGVSILFTFNSIADEVAVSESFTLRTSGKISTKTISVVDLPELPTPIFHLDSRRTENWTWSDANTKSQVSKIPSLSGSRYLKGGDGVSGTNGIDGGSWSIGDTVHRNPAYVLDEDLGEKVLDFGFYADNATFYGMLFDPVDFSAAQDKSALTNILKNIGTIVAVWYSSPNRCGGDIMGGGNRYVSTENFRTRNWSRMEAAIANKYKYAWPIFDSRTPLGESVVRQDGVWTRGRATGLKGRWQVLTIQPVDALNEASGIGVGGGRWNSGGFKVAEMYIFGELLSNEKIVELEVYLRKKWFGDTLPGFNGEAVIGEIRATSNNNNHVAASVTLEVAAGDKLSVDSLRGGHGNSGAYIKTGEGKLAIGDISTYDGELQVEAGEVDLTRRAVPTYAQLPHGMIVRFDASNHDCARIAEEDGVKYVSCLSNLVEGSTYNKSPIYARPPADNNAYRPWLVEDALGDGKNVYDFGPFTNGGKRDPYDGRYLRFTTAATGEVGGDAWNLPVCTAVAVIGAQRGGGHLLGYSSGGPNVFSRSDDAWMSDSSWHTASFFSSAKDTVSGNPYLDVQRDGVAYVNGIRRKTTEAFMTPGYQVVALQTTGGFASMLGGFQSQRSGGMRIGEIMLFCRMLDDREIKDVQAYLYNKWFGGYTPGYGPAVEGRSHVHKLNAAGDASLVIKGEIPVRVSKLSGGGVLEKKGSGTIEIESADVAGTIKIAEGSVKLRKPADVAAKCEYAAGARLHLDASDVTTVEAPYKSNISERVKFWYDKSGNGNVAYSEEIARCPYLNTVDTCNGLPVMDFREFNKATSGSMAIARTIDSARAVYVVWGTQNGGGHLFGYPAASWNYATENNVGSSWLDFTRKNEPTRDPGGSVGAIIDHQSSAQTVASGTIYTNGIKSVFSVVPTGDYQLFEFHTGEPSSVAGINIDRGSYPGGGRYGEILVYDRELSQRERIATRNYLLQKWFGKENDELEELPEESNALFKLNVILSGGNFEASGMIIDGDMTYASNTVLPVAFNSDGVVTNMPALTGKMTFGENMSVKFVAPEDFVPSAGFRLKFPTVNSYENVEALNNASFSGCLLSKETTPFFRKTASGRMVMSFGRAGLQVIVR